MCVVCVCVHVCSVRACMCCVYTCVWCACVYMLCAVCVRVYAVCMCVVCICCAHVCVCVVCMCVYAICTHVCAWCECVCMLCARVHGPGRAISSHPHGRLCGSSGASPARTQVEGRTSDLPPWLLPAVSQCPGPPAAPEKGLPASSGPHGGPAPLPHAESRRASESGRTSPAAGPQRGGQ